MYGFDEVIGNFCPDGLFHDVFFLVFGNHDDGEVGLELFDLRQRFQSIDSRHVFIQKYQVELLRFHGCDGISAATYGVHIVALALQE